MGVGQFAESADVLAEVLALSKRVCGKEHPNTLATATNTCRNKENNDTNTTVHAK